MRIAILAVLTLSILYAFSDPQSDTAKTGTVTFITDDSEKNNAGIGKLFYPGSEVTEHVILDLSDHKTDMVTMVSSDSIDKIEAYYFPMFWGLKDICTVVPVFKTWVHYENSGAASKITQVSAILNTNNTVTIHVQIKQVPGGEH